MSGYELLYLVSLVTFTFGALTFSVLAASWAVWGRRRAPGLAAFTAGCAAAFVSNLLLWIANALAPGSSWAGWLSAAADLATGLLPALLFHLIYRQEEAELPFPSLWKTLLAALYVLGAAGALLNNFAPAPLSDRLESAPAVVLSAAGAAGLAALFLARRPARPNGRRRRTWYRILLVLTLACAALGFASAADYLLLAFFAVTLYYAERLTFFDLLVKRGAFFAVALAGLTFFFVTAPAVYERLPAGWMRPWICALLLTPFWLLAPWVHERLTRAIDHFWLGRTQSPAEAERGFVQEAQLAADEEGLRSRAEASLGAIFRTAVHVSFDPESDPPALEEGLTASIGEPGSRAGWVGLEPRPNALPFLSGDHRLLDSLVRTLGVVLENVRFRERQRRQEERERELRFLAGRAELKALRAQINPHFLFNALNAIAGLIPDQPQLADETVERLAEVFRYTLRKAEKEWARLEEEVEFVAAYLSVEQARFGSRLLVEFEVDSAARSVPVPAMSIQPLIENAVKHGVAEVEGAGKVALRASLVGEQLAVEVFDNGPGFPADYELAADGTGHGLRNVAERLRGYYGEAARLWWENGSDGTRVCFRIPRQGAGI